MQNSSDSVDRSLGMVDATRDLDVTADEELYQPVTDDKYPLSRREFMHHTDYNLFKVWKVRRHRFLCCVQELNLYIG